MAEETSFTQVTVSPAVQPTPDHGSAASAPASSGRPALAGTAPASGPTARTNTGNREVAHMGPTTLGTGSRGLASSGSALRLKAVMQQEMASLRQEKLLRPETLVASLRDVRSEWADLRKEARAIVSTYQPLPWCGHVNATVEPSERVGARAHPCRLRSRSSR